MKTDLFKRVKRQVSVPEAAEHYGLAASRSGMACCPFHEDHHPSMKLYEDHFYCFACGAHGDVSDLAARLLNLSPREAAKRVSADFGLRGPVPGGREAEAPVRRADEERKDRALRQRCCRIAVNRYLHQLEEWKQTLAPRTPEEPQDPRYAEACTMLERTANLADQLTFGTEEELQVLADDLLQHNERAAALYEEMKRKEDVHHG